MCAQQRSLRLPPSAHMAARGALAAALALVGPSVAAALSAKRGPDVKPALDPESHKERPPRPPGGRPVATPTHRSASGVEPMTDTGRSANVVLAASLESPRIAGIKSGPKSARFGQILPGIDPIRPNLARFWPNSSSISRNPTRFGPNSPSGRPDLCSPGGLVQAGTVKGPKFPANTGAS